MNVLRFLYLKWRYGEKEALMRRCVEANVVGVRESDRHVMRQMSRSHKGRQCWMFQTVANARKLVADILLEGYPDRYIKDLICLRDNCVQCAVFLHEFKHNAPAQLQRVLETAL